MTILGLDVSHWNTPNWNALVAAGHKFAWLKASEGTNWVDPKYVAHRLAARNLALKTGPYHYFRAAFTGVPQAEHFWATVEATDLPPAVDVESRNNTGFEKSLFADRLGATIDRLIVLSGRRPLIYTSKSQWDLLVGSDPSISALCDLWAADYGWDGNGNGIGIPRIPRDWATWVVWQYTSKPLDTDRMKNEYWDLLFPPAPPAASVTVTIPKETAEALHTALHNMT